MQGMLAQLGIGRPATVTPIGNHLFDGQTQFIALVLDALGQHHALMPRTGAGVTIGDHPAVGIGAEMCFMA
jgi:hypothetical protein